MSSSDVITITAMEVDAALCVWEWLLDTRPGSIGADKPPTTELDMALRIEKLFDDFGSGAMRAAAVQAGRIVEACWVYANKHDCLPVDVDMFDWEFVPAVCRILDWDSLVKNSAYGDGLWKPDIEKEVAKLNALEALGVKI